MTDAYVNGKAIRLNPSMALGKGGEADVYDIGGGKVLKLFKQPNHPDLVGDPIAQSAAEERIAEHQAKLRAFPKNLPERVIAPLDFATDRSGNAIVGYTMRFLKGPEMLRYSERDFRNAVPNDAVLQIFIDLHDTVAKVHAADAVIGDFNDLNIIVAHDPYLIDADSMQFGKFLCRVFTDQFVDPILCDPKGKRLMLAQPHTADSDWYAFGNMLWRSLLFTDPYGGVYRPKKGRPVVQHPARPLHRITVFDPEVKYPKAAVSFAVLPDDLLEHYHKAFEKDFRGTFPLAILRSMRWTKCAGCGLVHARNACPVCALTAPAAVIATVIVRGKVTATRTFRTPGVIVRSAMHDGKLRYLYHENGQFKREDGATVLSGNLDPHMRYRIRGNATLFGKNGRLVAIESGKPNKTYAVDEFGMLPVFDANERSAFWTQNDQLQREGQQGPENVGNVLSGHTLIWAGPKFGFGFYRAGLLNVAFVFGTTGNGLNDSVKLPRINGKLIDATCSFTDDRCWFFVATQEGGKTLHRAMVIMANGSVEATAEAEAGDGSWLGTFGGGCATGSTLFMPTDEGIVRIEAVNNIRAGAAHGALVNTKQFPDTEPFVDAASQLYASSQGLIVVNRQEITTLKIA